MATTKDFFKNCTWSIELIERFKKNYYDYATNNLKKLDKNHSTIVLLLKTNRFNSKIRGKNLACDESLLNTWQGGPNRNHSIFVNLTFFLVTYVSFFLNILLRL